MNNNSAVVMVGAVFLIVICLWLVMRYMSGGGGGGGTVTEAYYLDLNTGKLVVDTNRATPPIETESGPTPEGQPAGVRAHVFACEGCGDYEGMTVQEVRAAGGLVAYLERYTPQAREALERENVDPMMAAQIAERGIMISAADSIRWVPQASQAAIDLQSAVRQPCPDGNRPEPCFP